MTEPVLQRLAIAAVVCAAVVGAGAPPSAAAEPIAEVAGVPWAYWYGPLLPVSAATVSIRSARLGWTNGHVSVWVSDDDAAGSWLQVGVTWEPGWPSPCAYVEQGDSATGGATLTCVRDVAFGERVWVRISSSARHGQVAWIDGVPVASARLGGGVDLRAGAERYGPGRIRWTLTSSCTRTPCTAISR